MFLCRTKKNRNLQDYQYVEHHIEIVSHDRDYSDVDVHAETCFRPRLKKDLLKSARRAKEKEMFYFNLETR